MKKEPRRIFSRQRATRALPLTPAQLENVTGGFRNGTVSWCDPQGRDDNDEI